MTATARPLAFATYYSQHGWPVFPLAPRTKLPIKDTHGFLDASIDTDVIVKWWEEEPEAGIGIPTGRASGIVVLDVDPRHGGDVSLAKLEAEHGPLPETVEAATGGGGRHLVFAYPVGDLEIRNTTKLAGLPGLDVRAEGGYIAVAPTIHPSGQPYRWRADRSPKTRKPVELAEWLLALMTAKAASNGNGIHVRAGLDTGKILEGLPDGERDMHLWGLACKLRGADVPIEAAFDLIAKAAGNCTPPFDLPKAYDKVKRAYAQYEPGTRTTRPEPKTDLVPMTSADLLAAARTPVEWAVRPLHTVKGVRITGAPGKTMKTTLTVAEMVSAIKGGTLAEQFEVGRGHTIAWFDAENSPRSWSRKFGAVCQGLKIDAQDIIDRGRFCYFNSPGLYLDDPSIFQAVVDAARKVKASQIVLDSLTRIHRQKENDAVAMSSFFVDRIFKLRDEAVAGITILHHTRKGLQGFRDNADDALRGTGDLRNVVDSYISMSRSRKDKQVFTLTVSAQRDAAEEGPFHFRTDWTDEQGVRFLKADQDDADAQEARSVGRPPSAYETACRIVREAIGADKDTTYTKVLNLCEAAGVGSTTTKRAWRDARND